MKDFREYHEANPQVWDAFRKYAFELIDAGRTKIGAKAIWERIRWDSYVSTSEKPYRLNNNYTAEYARMFMRYFPKYEGIFETRGDKVSTDENGQVELFR